LGLDPKQPLALECYAALLLNYRHDVSGAVDYYRRLTRSDPSRKDALCNYAATLLRVGGKSTRTQSTVHQAIREARQCAEAAVNLAQALFLAGRDGEARQVLEGLTGILGKQAQLEAFFYYYAHVPDEQNNALTVLHKLIVKE
jgi:predicted Zn-dependent protease